MRAEIETLGLGNGSDASPPRGFVRLMRGIRQAHAVALLAIFAVLYGWLLWTADFLPYVLDNNETFSSLWHAENLYRFGLSESWGLADEAFSPNAAAHPYVHTHQGNFPRLYAFLLYLVGARTAETQILVTTFTVALATFSLIYLVFERLATPWFAFVVTGVFMTDYVLFAQWQVVTYRVWYGFLLFCAIYTTLRLSEERTRSRKWVVAVMAIFACLFYFEFVFAAFVSIICFLFAVGKLWRTPLGLSRALLAQAAGGSIGLGVFVFQVASYLGWSNFVHDAYFTFAARNDFVRSEDFLREAGAFYEANRAIFWYNVVERDALSNVGAFVRSLTNFDWRIHSPLFSLLIWVLCFGWLVALLPRTGFVSFARQKWLQPCAFFVLFLGVVVFLINAGTPDNFIGSPVALTLGILVTVLGYMVAKEIVAERGGSRDAGLTWAIAGVGVLFGAVGLLFRIGPTLFDQAYRPVWEELHKYLGPPVSQLLFAVAATAIAARIAIKGGRSVLGESPQARLVPVLHYLVYAFVAYSVVYLVSPGYVVSGYVIRHAPFTVFLTDVLVAVGIYVLVRAARDLLHKMPSSEHGPSFSSGILAYANYSFIGASIGLTIALLFYWVEVQRAYIHWLPPNHYAFLKTLSRSPYKGASFIVDGYPAPVASATGQWAYNDPAFAHGWITSNDSGVRIGGDPRYLWLADRSVNPDYQKPQYFLCIVSQSMETVLWRVLYEQGRSPRYPGCSTRALVKLVRKQDSLVSGFRVVASDTVGPETIGFDAWTIVELGWDRGEKPVTLDWSSHASASGSYRIRAE